jgi:hypothetical protein
MHETTRTSPALLALAGLISGALTIVVSSVPRMQDIGVGFVFGLVLIGYFKGYEKQRSSLKLALFLCICTIAWPASNLSAYGAMAIGLALSLANPESINVPLPVFFVGGFMGALIVLGAGTTLFGHRQLNGRAVGIALLYSVGCGVLGVIAAAADGIRTEGTYHNMRYLPLIWQPGTALMLGLLIRKDRESTVAEMRVLPVADETASKAENPRLVAGAFLTLLVALIGVWVFNIVQAQREGVRAQVAQRRYDAEAPPSAELSPVESLPLEQLLVLDQIDGLYPSQALGERFGRLGRQYIVGYSAVKDSPPAMFVQRIALVEVVHVPNEAWAQYLAKNPRLNVVVVSPKSLTRVQRFGQTVVQDTYSNLCFHWPSSSFIVSVCFDTPQIHDAFLKRYLEKYPSSLVRFPADG